MRKLIIADTNITYSMTEAVYDENPLIISSDLDLCIFNFGEGNLERVSDWMRLINKLNNHDTTPILRMITGDNKTSDWDYFTVSRTDIEYSEDGFLIEFKEPIQVVVAEIKDYYIIVDVTKLKGEIHWEWSYYGPDNSSNNINGYANMLEILIKNVKIVE